jgi:hypothetical protein
LAGDPSGPQDRKPRRRDREHPRERRHLAKKLAQRTREREEAAAKLKRIIDGTLTVADITALIDQLGGIVKSLKYATAEERAEIYEALALKTDL